MNEKMKKYLAFAIEVMDEKKKIDNITYKKAVITYTGIKYLCWIRVKKLVGLKGGLKS